MNLYAPNGLLILEVLEQMQVSYELAPGSVAKDPEHEGEFVWEHTGDSNDFVDTAEPVKRNGQTVFIDTEGNEWLQSQLELRE